MIAQEDYSSLTGDPETFHFDTSQAGAVVNLGELSVDAGENISLIGGTVVNAGTLEAPEGSITVAAVEGESLVKISQGEQLLSLEVEPTGAHSGTFDHIAPASISEMLTGGEVEHATTLVTNADGTVSLSYNAMAMVGPTAPANRLPIEEGIGSAVATGYLSTEGEIGGDINVLGQQVELSRATLNASGEQSGGLIRVGGDYQGLEHIFTATHTEVSKGSSLIANANRRGDGGEVIVWAEEHTQFSGRVLATGGYLGGDGGLVEVSGRERLDYRGGADLSATDGELGTLLLDPMNWVITDGAAPTSNATTSYLSRSTIENAGGAFNLSLVASDSIRIEPLSGNGILRAPLGSSLSFSADTGRFWMEDTSNSIWAPGGTIDIAGAGIDVGAIRTDRFNGSAGSISLSSSLYVNTGAISSNSFNSGVGAGNGGKIVVEANGGDLFIDDTVRSWAYTNSSNNGPGNDSGTGGDVFLSARDNITINGSIGTASYADGSRANNGGNVSLSADTGNIFVNESIRTESVARRDDAGTGGDITLLASNGDIQTTGLVAFSRAGNRANDGGTIRLTANNITTNNIVTRSTDTAGVTGDAGNIFLTASDRIVVEGSINANSSGSGNDGSLSLVGDRIDLTGGDNSVVVAAASLSPSSSSRPVNIGLSVPDDDDDDDDDNPPDSTALNIWGTTLEALEPVRDGITIGSSSTGSVDLFSGAIAFSKPIHIQGGSELFSTIANTDIYITAPSNGYVNSTSITFSNIDKFGGRIDAIDVSYENFAGSSVDVDLENFTNIQSITGLNDGHNTLRGLDQDNLWEIDQENSGYVNGIRFNSFDTLIGGRQADQIAIISDGRITGVIDGNDGNNSLLVDGVDTLWRLSNRNQGTIEQNNTVLAEFQEISDIGSAGSTGTEQKVSFESANALISGSIEAGTSDLVLIGEDINIGDYLGNARISGSGRLTILPAGEGTAIQLGGDDSNGPQTLNITTGEIDAIQPGFIEIVIGSEDITGDIVLKEDVSFDDRVVLRSQSNITSAIETDGTPADIFGNQDITIEATNGQIQVGEIRTNNGSVTLQSADIIEVELIDTRGSRLTATPANIDIDTQTDFIAVSRTADTGASLATNSQLSNAINLRYGNSTRLANAFTIGERVSESTGTAGGGDNGILGNIATASFGVSTSPLFSSLTTVGNITLVNRGMQPPESPNPTLPELLEGITQPNVNQIAATTSTSKSPPIPHGLASVSEIVTIEDALEKIELGVSATFNERLGLASQDSNQPPATVESIQNTLRDVEQNTKSQPAVVYVYFVPDAGTDSTTRDDNSGTRSDTRPDDQLEMMVITPEGKPIRQRRWGVTREQVEAVNYTFREELTSLFSTERQYLPPAQQLYSWIMSPIEQTLESKGIDSIGFVMDTGLRMLPVAALHDGEHYLVENYSLGLLPTFSLTNFNSISSQDSYAGEGTQPSIFNETQVLAMGASRFETQPDLPAVGAEIDLITRELWEGNAFLNEDFVLENLNEQLKSKDYSILHLATHAVFQEGSLDDSYIQLWDEQLSLADMAESFNLSESDISLIILSACSTALGDEASEYGFAGFAVNAGSESALASLWPVNDEGTLGFMSQFYTQLRTEHLRAGALQQAQVSLIRGEVGIQDGVVYGPDAEILTTIPELAESGQWDFSHPAYWSAFTMIGNPW